MADEIKKVKIKELPQTTSINDDDIFVESDSIETYKVTASDIAKYVSTKVSDEYVNIVYSDTEPTTQRVGDYWCQDY